MTCKETSKAKPGFCGFQFTFLRERVIQFHLKVLKRLALQLKDGKFLL